MTQTDMPITKPATTSPAERIEELGRIILMYSDATERLQNSHGELTRKVEQMQIELSEKNRQLERTNRLAALGEMAAGLAHEIRNPLGGIQLYAAMLGQDVADRPDSLMIVRKITAGVRRLEELVSHVLHFTREINADPSRNDVVPIIRDAVELASPKAIAKNVRLEVITPDELIANIDTRLLGQAVLNLVQNAIEAVGVDGVVYVTLQIASKGQFVLVVADNGPGISEDVIDRIFNPFFTTKDEGTGLGLSIVHRIVEAHNGTISASNRTEGGAMFEIRI